MNRIALSAIALLVLNTMIFGAEPTSKNVQGKWVRGEDGSAITFTFTEKTLEIKLERDGNKLVLDNDFQVGREATVFGRVVEIKADGINSNATKGDFFSFVLDVEGDKVTVKDLKGTNVSEQAKTLIEGEYKKK